jgi:hypothetical protein
VTLRNQTSDGQGNTGDSAENARAELSASQADARIASDVEERHATGMRLLVEGRRTEAEVSAIKIIDGPRIKVIDGIWGGLSMEFGVA